MRGALGQGVEARVQPAGRSGVLKSHANERGRGAASVTESAARYVVGIDLGTTNSALAWVDLRAEGDLALQVKDLPLPQLVAAGETSERRLLPSNAYLPGEHELPAGATRLPWGEQPIVIGELAKSQGAKVPGRMVSSAKSWLCHPGVDRTADILPWGAPEGVPKISPVKASALYLEHLAAAWNHRFPDAPLAEQEVVLTVPASFDEVARELTVRAAKEAGLGRVRLLEEPQAAFYDWISKHRGRLEASLGGARLVLVCDVGGGTTDFTLIHAAIKDGVPALQCIAVGDHILLGGDNMDVTLARRVEARMGGARLDAAQWSMLVQACRLAKETLLTPGGPEKTRVSVVGRGSRLIGGALSAELSRGEVSSVVLDGFFPRTLPSDLPQKASRAGLTELGLPYAAEPAVTRHAAAFLRAHAAEIEQAMGMKVEGVPRPDALLLNGGVFTPREVAERLLEVLSGWFHGQPPIAQLSNEALDLAVARGAAYYGLVRRGLGLRIGGGTARAYFVGLDAPTAGEKRQAICIIPRHLEEQTEVEVPRTFALVLDRPVRFDLFATTLAQAEKPGELATLDEETFSTLPPIQTVLRSGEKEKAKGPVQVPVRLRAALTEIGTLELWGVATDRDARWKLEFGLRQGADDSALTQVAPMPKRFAEATAQVELVFGKKPAPVDKSAIKLMAKSLERILGPREGWATPLCRELWTALWAGQGKRRRTADHERVWCNLVGYCLRPGFGAPLDAWRASELWKLFDLGLQFQNEAHNWEAWWVLWRRVAGGLGDAEQKRLFDTVAPVLRPLTKGRTQPKPKNVKAEGIDEMIRLVASLERLPAELKVEAAGWVFERISKDGPRPHLVWSVGRLGARVPFYGSGHTCVPSSAAEEWIGRMLELATERPDELVFPLAQLARLSGDRARDLPPAVRERVAQRLAALQASPDLVRSVREVVELSGGEEQKVFGESLPAGLKLLGPEG
ncbi:MAG: hsp70 family protein [Deltaproteobacteria bacterium]|nr:hsp70 family protein [Deltaproteobacteria bacterium]